MFENCKCNRKNSFVNANKLLKKSKVKTEKKDLTGEGEKKLGELFPDTIVFVHDWPIKGKLFYIMPKGTNLSHGFDAIYQGMEITSGGQRVHIPAILERQLRERKLNSKDFKTYIDSFRFGAPPHAGWGIGLERFVAWVCGLKTIKDAIAFPRTVSRVKP